GLTPPRGLGCVVEGTERGTHHEQITGLTHHRRAFDSTGGGDPVGGGEDCRVRISSAAFSNKSPYSARLKRCSQRRQKLVCHDDRSVWNGQRVRRLVLD